MTDEVIVTDDAGKTAAPPSAGQNLQGHADKLLQEKGFRAAFEHESRVREEVDRIQQQEGIGP